MENKKQIGGKRRGAGRKPVLNKKKQISLYVEGAKIIKFGNEENMKEHLYGVIDRYGVEPSYENSISNIKELPNYSVPAIKVEAETKSPVTGLPPKLSDFDGFMEELNNAKTISQVNEIMRRAKGGIMFPRQKVELEAFAKEISADMFSD